MVLGWPTMVFGGYWATWNGRAAWNTAHGEYQGSAGPTHWLKLPKPPRAGAEFTAVDDDECPNCDRGLRGSFPLCIDCQLIEALKNGD